MRLLCIPRSLEAAWHVRRLRPCVLQAVEQLLLKYRACLPYDAWRQVCLHYMFLVRRLLPVEDACSAQGAQRAAQSQAGSVHGSSRESVAGGRSHVEGCNSSEYDYTCYQHHNWTAANAVVPAPAAGEGTEVMAWALLPAAQGAMQQLVHGVLHRLLHQPPPAV